MSWKQYSSTMEQYAIKTDDMATEDAYFMATHMPFAQLEVYRGGKTTATPKVMSETEVFEKFVYNPDNEHRMIIVRGDNGTGKSHLIRYLKAKLEHSPATIYNPANEQLIFLRRLNNSVRGAFSQLIEQEVIKDPEVEKKLKKFVDSSEAKDEETFKTDILYSYIAAVKSDKSQETYKSAICQSIASFLADSRVTEHLLREGGAISRCYTVITAPSDQVLKDNTIFSADDFNVKKILKEVYKQGDPLAQDFATTLKDDDSEITKLVNYLNKFTRDVVQRCADISSESTKSVFVELRKDLKKQAKNLTLFIEDFTGFTGIDSELITVLSTEHGGDYADLCRVTAIIGITNDYYDQFRDNFTDRVTHQISVTYNSFSTEEFLVQMSARYLNAIYCAPDAIREWNKNGAVLEDLPISEFAPPCKWETTTIEGKEVTLYPFNKNAIMSLYDHLPVKSPRRFLKDVIRAQLKEFFDGKEYGDDWHFPLNQANIQMSNDPHSSTIDRLESFSVEERNRLKSVLAIWGDGSATYAKTDDCIETIGGLNKNFLSDIALSEFAGIGSGEKTPEKKSEQKQVATEIENTKKAVDGATKDYLKYKDDITAWFVKNESLKYDADYRNWLRTLFRGDAKQCGAINWQDIGVPAYIADERLADLAAYYIDDQSQPANVDKAIVFMDRSAESRDALFALNELRYAKGWDFEGAAYYQQRLITWLERRKDGVIEKVIASKVDNQLPVLEWCIALQYLKACILGHKIDMSSPVTILQSLMKDIKKNDKIKRETREWNDLIQFTQNKEADFFNDFNMLKRSAATTMGAIHFSAEGTIKSCYRTNELISAVEHLVESKWDIEKDLPETIPAKHLIYNPATLLKSLYANVKKAMAAEIKQVDEVMKKVEDYIGEINKDNLVSALRSVQDLFSVFAQNGILGANDLRTKYEAAPIDIAKDIIKHADKLLSAKDATAVMQLGIYSENSLNAVSDFLRDLQEIALKAETEEAKASKDVSKTGEVSNIAMLSEAATESMKELYSKLEKMEVYDDATDGNY